MCVQASLSFFLFDLYDMASNDEYEIGIIENETDARLCTKLICDEFALHNKMSIFTHFTGERLFDEWLWPLMMEVLHEKLSFFVRHRPTNEIIAAIIASDLFIICEKHQYDASGPAADDPVDDLYDEMRDQFIYYDFGQKIKPNMVLYITAGATLTKHTGKGVASLLRNHLCNHARDVKGFQYAFIQTSNAATRHIYVNKMNGKELRTVDPATWLWEKKDDGLSHPLKDYKGEQFVNILVKL
jgi:hypothetical protein